MEERLKQEIVQAKDITQDLRRQFLAFGERFLNSEQLQQVFKNLGMQFTPEQFKEVFQAIDKDKSGTVDIDEVMNFMRLNSSNVSKLAQAAVINMRSTQSLQLDDLREIFSKLPADFIQSTLHSLLAKGLSLPSSVFRPMLAGAQNGKSNQLYVDLQYPPQLSINALRSQLDKNIAKLKTLLLITIDGAIGVIGFII